MNTLELAKIAYKSLDDKMGIDIKVLDISEISIMGDYFIVASGSNPNQLKAMSDDVEQELYKVGCKLKHTEGHRSNTWVLLDFGDIIVHIFNQEDREFYLSLIHI